MITRIGGAVQQARAQRDWSVERLAAEASVPVQVLEAFEQGRPGLTTTQRQAVAAALGVEESGLRQGRVEAVRLPSVYLRHRGLQHFHDSDMPVLDQAVAEARALGELGALLGEVASPWTGRRSDAPRDDKDAAAKDGYRAAGEVRKHLRNQSLVLEDLREVSERGLGIAVLVRPLSSRAACAVKAGNAAAIVLDAAEYATRPIGARIAIAHELSHLLHDPDDEGVHIVLDRESSPSADANERRARAHAAELLLPRTGLQGLLGLPRQVRETDEAVDLVKRAMDHFGASWDVTANHLCNHRFVARELRTWLEAARAHPLPARWPMTLPATGSPSVLLQDRARRAHIAGLITDGDARSLLRIEAIDPLPWDPDR